MWCGGPVLARARARRRGAAGPRGSDIVADMPRLLLVLGLLAPRTLACGDDNDGTGASEEGSATDGTGGGPGTASASMSDPNTTSASMSEPTTTGDDTASADP